MAENLGKWASNRGLISKIRPSDGCKGDTVPSTVVRGYDLRKLGGHLGNVGLRPGTRWIASWNCRKIGSFDSVFDHLVVIFSVKRAADHVADSFYFEIGRELPARKVAYCNVI